MDNLTLSLGPTAFLFGVGLHSLARRVRPSTNSIIVYAIVSLLVFLALCAALTALHSQTIVVLATLTAYGFLCELYAFLITFVAGSITIARLLSIEGARTNEKAAMSPEKMVAARLEGLESCRLIRRENGSIATTPIGGAIVTLYRGLHCFFGHDSQAQNNGVRPGMAKPPQIAERLYYREVACWLIIMALLVCLVYRNHLGGSSLYLGNFDRLNSILNVQLADVNSLRSGDSPAWDNSMFMGRNILALPFSVPTPLNRLIALFPSRYFYWMTGDISIALVILAGWSAFGFIVSVVKDPFPAFVGATLYQFSALSILHASQNTLSYAVLIDLPLLFLIARGTKRDNWCRSFVFESVLLCHLLFFCFLQEVAYAVLMMLCYTAFLAVSRRSLKIMVALTLALVVAAIFSFPRVYGIVQDFGQLRRQISDDFKMKDFDALYYWQNFQHADVLRWFNDGIFGRYYGEMQHLNNNINITEGMLAYTGTIAPFFVLVGLIIWRRRWFGLVRGGNGECLFFYAATAAAFAVIFSKQAYHLLFSLFLRIDFTHTRVLVAVMPLLCLIVAEYVASLSIPSAAPSARHSILQLAGASLLAVIINTANEYWCKSTSLNQPVALMSSFKGVVEPFVATGALLFGISWKPSLPAGNFVIWLRSLAVGEVDVAVITSLVVLLAVFLTRTKPLARRWVVAVTGLLMVCQSWTYANFQVNGAQIRTDSPFEDSNSFAASPSTFLPPTASQLSEIHSRLQTESYRTVFAKGPDKLPAFTAPHLGAFWQLRLVEGYSSGVPSRLAMLPWPAGSLGLRTLTFGYTNHDELPWDLLGFLNVRFAVDSSKALYENVIPSGSSGEIPSITVTDNPARVTPRVFFARDVLCVKNEFSAAFAIESPKHSTNRFIDPEQRSVIETSMPLSISAGDGSIAAKYSRDHIEVTVSRSLRTRLLVLNELFTPWWKAYEDGHPVPIYPANLVMRSVVVTAGVQSISFVFKPFCNAMNVTIFAALAFAWALLSIKVLSRMEIPAFETR